MDDDVIKFPINAEKRTKNRRGEMSTSCYVTDRWIKFRNKPASIKGKVLMWADIMTLRDDGSDHKLCEFCFDLTEMEKLIAKVKAKAE